MHFLVIYVSVWLCRLESFPLKQSIQQYLFISLMVLPSAVLIVNKSPPTPLCGIWCFLYYKLNYFNLLSWPKHLKRWPFPKNQWLASLLGIVLCCNIIRNCIIVYLNVCWLHTHFYEKSMQPTGGQFSLSRKHLILGTWERSTWQRMAQVLCKRLYCTLLWGNINRSSNTTSQTSAVHFSKVCASVWNWGNIPSLSIVKPLIIFLCTAYTRNK